MAMYDDLLTAIETSDLPRALTHLDSLLSEGHEPWIIHEALFPLVHRVLNPPFINPHLPKMYAVNREFVQFLESDDIATLLRLEVEEYTRRDKVPPLAKPSSIPLITDFGDIEAAIASKSVPTTAVAMASFLKLAGPTELARRLLILGSGFLDHSLGHSISCTAFILLEMVNRKDEDTWPTLVLLSEYFCSGNFHRTPTLQYSAISDYPEVYLTDLKRAISGTGIVALHHTITLYAIERSRHFLTPNEHDHVLTMWVHMLADKEELLHSIETFTTEPLPNFDRFFNVFKQHYPMSVLSMVNSSLNSEADRARLSCCLIKSVLKCYNGNYNPHYLTGLGASLWIIENYYDQPTIVLNCLSQYLDFFFSRIS
jgi:hypothetical protein